MNWSVDLLFFLIKKCISYNCWFHIGHYLYHQPISQSNSARLSKVCHLWEVQLANHQILLIFEVFYSYGLVVTHSTWYLLPWLGPLGHFFPVKRSVLAVIQILFKEQHQRSFISWLMALKVRGYAIFTLWQALFKDL